MKAFTGRSAWILVVLFALFIFIAQGYATPEIQEEGVLYFEGNLPNKVTATLKGPLTVYLQRDFQKVIASLAAGQSIEVIGMSPEGFVIAGPSQNHAVTGWIRTGDLPAGVDAALFEQAKKNQEHRDAVAVAIRNKTVIAGMTPDEVTQAMGKPSRTDASGAGQTWTYTTYREAPQYTYGLDAQGHAVLQTYYEKIQIGQMIVTFGNGVVTATEERKTDPSNATN